MTRLARLALALSLLVTSCAPGGGAPTETDQSSCSNGRDDDSDGMTDCRDLACTIFSFCAGSDGGVDASVVDASVDAGPPADGASCDEPLDVVFTIDVSSSMAGELAAVRDGALSIWDNAHTLSSNVQFSLVVFVDDALAENGCAPFETQEALAERLEFWRVESAMNLSPGRRIPNTDCPENAIDAMYLAASTCPFRAGSTRILVHVTDDTFAERPAVLSGPFGGGIFVEHTYAELVEELLADEIRVGAFAIPGMGEDCGAGRSADVGRGYHTPYGSLASLPTATGGRVWDLREVRGGTVSMATSINEMIRAEYCTDF